MSRKHYKTGYCFTSMDLFDNFNLKLIKMSGDECYKHYNTKNKKRVCAHLLNYCFYLILLDIIENNVTFEFPLKFGQEACIYVKQFTGDVFKKLYRTGKFMGIDYLRSNFTGYQMYFQYKIKNGSLKEKPLYISSKLKEKFYNNINNGKQYY